MKKTKKAEPYIDYKRAKQLAWMRAFIVNAKRERDLLIKELERQISFMQMSVRELKTVSDDPDNFCISMDKWGFKDNVARLRNAAWEAGLTSTLFKKLEDHKFWLRFTGRFGEPVLKEEIEDRYFEEDEASGVRKSVF